MRAGGQPTRAVLYAVGALAAAFVCATIVISGATKWFPEGAAGIDHIVVPIVAFPLVWAGFGLALYGSAHRARAWSLVLAVTGLHAGLVAYGMLG